VRLRRREKAGLNMNNKKALFNEAKVYTQKNNKVQKGQAENPGSGSNRQNQEYGQDDVKRTQNYRRQSDSRQGKD